MKFLLSLPPLLVICGMLYAQQFPIRRLSVEDGIGHSIVYRTTQSSDGYIWFSTDNGLTRYDGATFRNFTTADGLPSNFIFDVVEWKGQMYVCTLGGGIVKYANGKFTPAFDSSFNMPLHPVELRISDDYVLAIDRFKALHILQGDRFEKITPEHLGVERGRVFDFYQAEIYDDVAFIGTSKGLFTYTQGNFTRIPLSLPMEEPFIWRIKKLDDKKILLIFDRYLLEYELDTNTYRMLKDDQLYSRYSRALIDSEQNLWVSTVDGNLYFIQRNQPDAPTLKVLEGIVINDIFEDRERNIWLSTYGEGVWLVQSSHVRNYPIKGCIVSDLALDPVTKDVLVTTINAGLRIFRKDGAPFLHEIESNRLKKLFAKNIFLGPTLNLENGSLLIGAGHTLHKVRDDRIDSVVTPSPVTSLYYQRAKNRIWIGCRFFLGYCDTNLDTLVKVPQGIEFVVRSIAELPDGKIVLGTDRGIRIESGDRFLPAAADSSIQHADINSLYYDRHRNLLWVATNNGLARYSDGRLTLFDNPLTRVRCNSITEDQLGNLYIGSVKGLIFFDGQTFKVVATQEGLSQSNIIRVNYQAEYHLLTLLAPNSISTINTRHLPYLLQFKLPDILVLDIRTPEETIPYTGGTVQFASPVKQLSIRLSTPQIRNRDKIRYSYRVDDKDWIPFDGNEISLHSIPTGRIEVSIMEQKVYDESETKTLHLTLYIPPPFYYQWWFISSLSLAAVLALVFLVISYSRQKNETLLEENKRLDVEHKALRNLLNPHFLYNAINSIHAFILQNDQRQTLGYLSKFSQLVRLNLELLSSDRATLEKEIKNISLYLEFEKLRFAEKLIYSIVIDPRLVQAEVVIPPFIIQPFVENAIWHGLLPRAEGGKLDIRVRPDAKSIIVEIDDNGIGINQSLKHPKTEIDKKSSMGINIIRERFELLRKVNPGYQLHIIDKTTLDIVPVETGTLVTIIIPH